MVRHADVRVTPRRRLLRALRAPAALRALRVLMSKRESKREEAVERMASARRFEV